MAANSAANALPRALPRQAAAPRLPVSGSEEVFADITYGTRRGRGNNNCYAWAIGDYRNSGSRKLQPGNLHGAKDDMNLSSCADIARRAAADLRGRAYAAKAEDACRPGYYKVMSFLAKDNDYHWYKQHRHLLLRWPANWEGDVAKLAAVLKVPVTSVYVPRSPPRAGDVVLVKDARVFSHKQGFATGPVLYDACGAVITDPRKACRTYSADLDYSKFCSAMCVKSRRSGGSNAARAAGPLKRRA